jgi:hypothetical protein
MFDGAIQFDRARDCARHNFQIFLTSRPGAQRIEGEQRQKIFDIPVIEFARP